MNARLIFRDLYRDLKASLSSNPAQSLPMRNQMIQLAASSPRF